MISVTKAKQLLNNNADTLDECSIKLNAALGMILSKDLVSQIDLCILIHYHLILL